MPHTTLVDTARGSAPTVKKGFVSQSQFKSDAKSVAPAKLVDVVTSAKKRAVLYDKGK